MLPGHGLYRFHFCEALRFFLLCHCSHLAIAHPAVTCNNQLWPLVTRDFGHDASLRMDEREFFDERPEKKVATLNCPHCQQSAEYEINWLVRTKKKQLSGRADERDRARFAKARSYMLRRDDMMACKNMRCRKRFEISGVQSVVFTE